MRVRRRWPDRLERVQGMGAGPAFGRMGGNRPNSITCLGLLTLRCSPTGECFADQPSHFIEMDRAAALFKTSQYCFDIIRHGPVRHVVRPDPATGSIAVRKKPDADG